MIVKFFPLICCDYCRDVFHMEFECPVCEYKHASTSIWHDLFEYEDEDFECEDCGSRFKILSKEGYEKVNIELIRIRNDG